MLMDWHITPSAFGQMDELEQHYMEQVWLKRQTYSLE